MAKPIESSVGNPLDRAIIHTPCTACRARLHRLRMLLEVAEGLTTEPRRTETVANVELATMRALKRLEGHVHVCVEALGSV